MGVEFLGVNFDTQEKIEFSVVFEESDFEVEFRGKDGYETLIKIVDMKTARQYWDIDVYRNGDIRIYSYRGKPSNSFLTQLVFGKKYFFTFTIYKYKLIDEDGNVLFDNLNEGKNETR